MGECPPAPACGGCLLLYFAHEDTAFPAGAPIRSKAA